MKYYNNSKNYHKNYVQKLASITFAMTLIIILSGCGAEPRDTRTIAQIFDSGEYIECTFVEIPPEGRLDLQRYHMSLSYARDSLKLESSDSESFLLVTSEGTIEPLSELRHNAIYDVAIENECGYILNDELKYNFVMSERYGAGLVGQVFGGIPFIVDEQELLIAHERRNNDKLEFKCRAVIPDTRFEVEENVCDTRMFTDIIMNPFN